MYAWAYTCQRRAKPDFSVFLLVYHRGHFRRLRLRAAGSLRAYFCSPWTACSRIAPLRHLAEEPYYIAVITPGVTFPVCTVLFFFIHVYSIQQTRQLLSYKIEL